LGIKRTKNEGGQKDWNPGGRKRGGIVKRGTKRSHSKESTKGEGYGENGKKGNGLRLKC